jgi:hypothetical protein
MIKKQTKKQTAAFQEVWDFLPSPAEKYRKLL